MTLPDGGSATGTFTGDGPIDAVFQAINAATRRRGEVSATSRSARSPRARTRSARSRWCSRSTASRGAGQGVSTDIIDAAARAYVRALSVAVARSQAGERLGLPETA